MNSNTQHVKTTICAVLISCAGCNGSWQRNIRGYRGDGEILDTSLRDADRDNSHRGFSIVMPVFDLAGNYKREYRLEGIPEVEGISPIVFFVIQDAEHWIEKNTESVLDIELGRVSGAVAQVLNSRIKMRVVEESRGSVLVDVDAPLREFKWNYRLPHQTSEKREAQLYKLYMARDGVIMSSFKANGTSTYKVLIEYQSVKSIPGAIAFVEISQLPDI